MKNEPLSGKELRRAVRLWCCVAIIAIAVFVKLLFPDLVENVQVEALNVLGGNVDYKAALAVMGEAVAGEKGFGEAVTEACQYAFRITDDEAIEADAEATSTDDKKEEAKVVKEVEIPTIRNLTYIHSGEEAPPDGASYAMVNMNLDYCMPVNGSVTSSFGYREHPADGTIKFHYGTDFGAEEGTEIRAFSDGEVYAIGESSTLGLYVMIDHADGVRTIYGHLSEVMVSGGDMIEKGQKIGEVGSTGNATGSCLHFEIKANGVNVDPEYYLTWV